jgi:hypothetical protein
LEEREELLEPCKMNNMNKKKKKKKKGKHKRRKQQNWHIQRRTLWRIGSAGGRRLGRLVHAIVRRHVS